MEFIRNNYPQYQNLRVAKLTYRFSNESTGIYAIVKSKNGWALRMSPSSDLMQKFKTDTTEIKNIEIISGKYLDLDFKTH